MFFSILVIPSNSPCKKEIAKVNTPQLVNVEIEANAAVYRCRNNKPRKLNFDANLIHFEIKHQNGFKLLIDKTTVNGLASVKKTFTLKAGEYISCKCSFKRGPEDESRKKTLYFSQAASSTENGGTFKWQVLVELCVNI